MVSALKNNQTSKETFKNAFELVKAGKHADAEPLLHELLGRHPGHADVLHLVGLVRLETGYFNEAVHAFKATVKKRPD